MVPFPRAQCRSCRASVSYFAGSCLQCGASNQPNPVTVAAGLVCAAVLIAVQIATHVRPPQVVSERPGESGSATPNEEKADNYGWLIQAMAECDAEAKEKLDKFHFLIVPLAPTGTSLPGWSPQPISDIGRSGRLRPRACIGETSQVPHFRRTSQVPHFRRTRERCSGARRSLTRALAGIRVHLP